MKDGIGFETGDRFVVVFEADGIFIIGAKIEVIMVDDF